MQKQLKPQLHEYIDTKVHPIIETREIRKGHAVEDVDRLETGNWDLYINFLVSSPSMISN